METPSERRALRDQLRVAKWQIFGSSLTAFGGIMFTSGIALIFYAQPMTEEANLVITIVYFTLMLGGLTMLAAGFILPFRIFNRVERFLDELDDQESKA